MTRKREVAIFVLANKVFAMMSVLLVGLYVKKAVLLYSKTGYL
jgi:hypothetical protein